MVLKMDLDTTHSESPFHVGEKEAQTHVGVREKIEKMGSRMIRTHLPEQHQDFYRQLPFLVVGTIDQKDRLWASLLTGTPGFMSVPDEYHLKIATQPLFGSPLSSHLHIGGYIGGLGILPENRRRNRFSGKVVTVDDNGILVEIAQTYGNCPQYIQSRKIDVLPEISDPQKERVIEQGDRLTADTKAVIEQSDTFFIATAYSDNEASSTRKNPAFGADVSHRGGKPGFVRVEDNQTIIFPDFTGNFIFNTVGNILVNPNAGLLFIDFETRDLLYLTGRAEVIWEGEAVDAFLGAERLIRCQIESWRSVKRSLPLQFEFGEYSPNLQATGRWGTGDR